MQDVTLKRVDHDAAVSVVPEVEQSPQKPLPLGERDLDGAAAEERPADRLDSQFTLAHEMGHALHSYMISANKPSDAQQQMRRYVAPLSTM